MGVQVLGRLLASTRLGSGPLPAPSWLHGSTRGELGGIPKAVKPVHVDQHAPHLVAECLESVHLLSKVIPALRGTICMEALGYAGICPVTSGGEFAADF